MALGFDVLVEQDLCRRAGRGGPAVVDRVTEPSTVEVTYHQWPDRTGTDMSVSWTLERISSNKVSIVDSCGANQLEAYSFSAVR